jgi:hypothetical protein
MDARDIYEYRQVTLNLQSLNNPGSHFARRLFSSGETCSGPELDRSLCALTASANWQTLHQNDGLDGWPDTLWEATGLGRKPPYAFDNSDNALEDTLGLVAALVGSMWNTTSTKTIGSEVVVTNIRMGSGKLPALAYLFPPVFAAALLLALIISTCFFKRDNSRVYSSAKLEDLIEFGKEVGQQAGSTNGRSSCVTKV